MYFSEISQEWKLRNAYKFFKSELYIHFFEKFLKSELRNVHKFPKCELRNVYTFYKSELRNV